MPESQRVIDIDDEFFDDDDDDDVDVSWSV